MADQKTEDFVAAEAARAAEVLGVDEPQNAPQEPVTPASSEPASVTTESGTETPVTTEPTPTVPTVEVPPIEPVEDDEPDIPTFYNPFTTQPQQAAPVPPQAPIQQVQNQQPSPAPDQSQVPPLDVRQFTDQYGNVDMSQFTQAMKARDEALVAQVQQNLSSQLTGRITQDVLQQAAQQAQQIATQQVMSAKAEERAWEQTFKKYPQVKENKELRDQIHKMRIGEVALTNRNVSPVKMADRYFSQITAARQEGVRQATVQTETQAVAHLESSSTTDPKNLQTQNQWANIANRDRRTSEAARTSLLKQMMADGKL